MLKLLDLKMNISISVGLDCVKIEPCINNISSNVSSIFQKNFKQINLHCKYLNFVTLTDVDVYAGIIKQMNSYVRDYIILD
jgi:2C-methyl-D-erythritol 2,4-cyclodiphosphate synthase